MIHAGPPRKVHLLAVLTCLLVLPLCMSNKAHAQVCSATVNDVDFGAPNVLSADATDALASVTVSCTHVPFLTVVKICPSFGDGSGGSSNSVRQMRGGNGNILNYQLYQDAGRTASWGAVNEPQLGTVPSMLLSAGLSGSASATETIYGRLFGNQTSAAPGNYVSTFTGGDSAFTYSGFLLGATNSCAGFVGAATIHPSFNVAASAPAYCTLTTTDLNFGIAGVLQAQISAQTNLRVACTNKTPFSVSLDGGLAHGLPTQRKMTSPAGDAVAYGLYRDAARTQGWGDTSSTWMGGTGIGTDQSLAVYGLVPAQVTPRPGSFSDRVVATVTY
jgi:spore coat protein U-like protein